MGYLAVLADSNCVEHVSIGRLHVNLWALRGLLRRARRLYFDVGIEICHGRESPEAKLQKIDLLLPFKIGMIKDKPDSSDLFDMVINPETGALIFGAPTTVQESSDGRAKVLFEDVRLNAVKTLPSELAEGSSNSSDGTLCTIRLQHPVDRGESAYIRTRWRVDSSKTLWKWMLSPQAGAWADFRISDTRQGGGELRDPDFVRRLLPIETANVFVMAPGHLTPSNCSPHPKYIRTLEPGVWKRYLRGAARYEWMFKDLLVYGWARKDKTITQDHPMRVFISLTRVFFPSWASFPYMLVAAMIAFVIVTNSPGLWVDLGPVWTAIGVTTVLGLLSAIQWFIRLLRFLGRIPYSIIRAIEERLLT